jgi:hypothetical protein
MTTFNTIPTKDTDTSEPNWALSMAAAIPSGIIKTFEGAATFGAALLDLGVDKDRVEAVEAYFDKINPFDEAAASTGIGKITELIVNIGVPGGLAFKAASGLGKATIAAKQAGRYIGKGEKARRFAQGSLGAGLAEGVAVGDVQDAGSFGDFLGGPTEINRDSDSAANELLNRLKFGIEGAAFTGAFGAAGKLVGKMREVRGSNKVKRGFDKSVDKLDSWFRSNGLLTQEGFDARNVLRGRVAKDTNVGDVAMREIDKLTDNLARSYNKVAVSKVPFLEAKKTIGKELNDVLMSGTAKNGKLKPKFQAIDEIALDATGQEFKTGKQLYDVQIESIPVAKKEALRKLLKSKYKADDKDVTKLFNQFDGIRDTWSELFTIMGRRLTPESLKSFENMIPKYINDVLDRGYEYVKATGRNPIQLANNNRPSATLIREAVKEFQDIAAQKGLTLNDDLAKDMVDEVWKGAYLPGGITIGKTTAPGQVRFAGAVPAFMKDSLAATLDNKSILDPKYNRLFNTNISELSGVSQDAIKKLLGKARNPMSTIVDGTANLSSVVRNQQFFDDLILKNNELKKNYDEWIAGGRVGPEPRIPFLYNNTSDAMRYAGGTSDDFAEITSAKGDAAREIDRWLDPAATIKTIDADSVVRTGAKGEILDLLNPLQGKFALKDYAQSFKSTQESAKSMPRQIYNSLILYPKGLSQMSKTILAPFTHARNFISATAFAAANGHLPFGNIKDVKAAFNALQAKGFRRDNPFYQELLELGVVNSNVQMKQIADLLEDVDFGKTLNKLDSDYGLGRFLKGLRKIKRGAEDYYTAEDDFWKIFTYLGEKSKLGKAYDDAGIKLGQEFIDMNGAKQILNDQYLKKAAADLVKNNVPNYAFVSDFIKGLRQLPVGNFVAFPAEIIRTSSNIVETALKEINYKTIVNGKTVNPLRKRGLQRLTGMALTTAALPLGTVAAAQAAYNIADDEIDAMRRYVADWSKNSVLVPFKDEDGKLSYIDFSHLNAYDTVTRPIQTVLNKVNAGRADEDGIVDDFILGTLESTKELALPFISESIWTEGLADIFVRRGRTQDNRQLWNEKDAAGDKISKSIGHLIETQTPLNWKQLTRLGLSIRPINDLGRFDERGNQYEFGNELAGIAGLRRVEVNPEKSFNYKITDFKKGIRNSRNLFTSATLKGGVVTPEEIVDAYINANRALYETNRELFLDIEAAKTLGMKEDDLFTNMRNRGENRAFNFINEGTFRPLTISRDVRGLFERKARELGTVNPYDKAADVIDRIRDVLSEVSLEGDLFPTIENPLKSELLPDLVSQANQMINNNPANAAMAAAPTAGFGVGLQNTNIDPVTRLTSAEEILLDPLEKRYVKNKRTTTRLT